MYNGCAQATQASTGQKAVEVRSECEDQQQRERGGKGWRFKCAKKATDGQRIVGTCISLVEKTTPLKLIYTYPTESVRVEPILKASFALCLRPACLRFSQ